MNNEKLIQGYITGRLSKKDSLLVVEMLQNDSEFKAEYDEYKAINTAFSINETKNLKAYLQNLEETNTNTLSIKKVLNTKFTKLAIACMLIVGAFYFINQPQSGNTLYKSYFEPCSNTFLPITRGENQKTLTFKAFQAYENNNFKKSENIFSDILKTTDNKNIRFYYAMSLLNQNKSSEALQELERINKDKFDYQIESIWYSSLILIKNKDYKTAKKHLLALKKLNSTFKSKEINAILDNIE